MKQVNFLFGVHCHQPVGNFDYVIEEAYKKAYLPFIKALSNHPKIKFSAHYSGVLLLWFKKHHPEFIDLLNRLVRRGQLELISGGMYEPVMAIIPDHDKIAQIELQQQFFKEEFGTAPIGLWLAERVWEPNLPKILAPTGLEYTMLDDYHFTLAGVPNEDLFGYYITEDQGETINVFPINKVLRYLVPFEPASETIRYLESIASEEGDKAAVLIDDGEKLGFRDQGYAQGYLEELLTKLEENSAWIKFMTFTDYLDEYAPKGRVYLPGCAYQEMMEWSGGSFRNFLIKYPEANLMQKKMLQVSRRLASLKQGATIIGHQEQDQRLKLASQYLYQAQCNCAYWHGLFGGLYYKHLRQAVYQNLIKAELLLEQQLRGARSYVDLALLDLDKDGQEEVIMSNDMLSLVFAPAIGGSLVELDYKPRAYNLLNSLSRRPESYHVRPALFDRYNKTSFLDHFLSPEASLKKFASQSDKKISDFVTKQYSFMPRKSPAEVSLKQKAQGLVEGIPVEIEKNVSLCKNQSLVTIEYKITNQSDQADEFWFGTEFNFSMVVGDLSVEEETKVKTVKIVDESTGFDVLLEMDRPTNVWRLPIVTVSRSEEGQEENYQSTTVFLSWRFSLESQASFRVKINLRLEE